MHVHADKDIIENVIVLCSLAHTFLPPWDAEAFAPFPGFQKFYKLFIYLVGYAALNARSSVYRTLSVSNPQGPNFNGGKPE